VTGTLRPPTVTPTSSLTLFVPCRVWSVNEQRRWIWQQRSREQRKVRELAAMTVLAFKAAVRRGKEPPVSMGTPVGIEVTPVTARRIMDADNSAGMAKHVIDGLVDAGLLSADMPDVVAWVRFNTPEKGRPEGLRLELVPA